MIDPKEAIQRFRLLLKLDNKKIVNFEQLLPRHFPIIICILPNLSASSISSWINTRNLSIPRILTEHSRKQLRGGIIARMGGAIIFVDGADDADQQRYSLAHEAGHFFINHFFPREDIVQRMGISVLEVIDGLRAPTSEERIQAILHHTSLTHYSHFIDRNTTNRGDFSLAESYADAFALEAIAPIRCVLSMLPGLKAHSSEIPRVVEVLETAFHIPHSVAMLHAGHICCRYGHRPGIHCRFGI